jgi:hypothetical protein
VLVFRLWKQFWQYTGRSPRGSNGTVVCCPHPEQITLVLWDELRWYPPPPPGCSFFLAWRHVLQRLGAE